MSYIPDVDPELLNAFNSFHSSISVYHQNGYSILKSLSYSKSHILYTAKSFWLVRFNLVQVGVPNHISAIQSAAKEF
jgi:hypothetical protein